MTHPLCEPAEPGLPRCRRLLGIAALLLRSGRYASISHVLQQAEGFGEFVGGFDFREPREAAVDEDIVVVAGEHELL